MFWNIRKSKNIGPLKGTLSKNGLGASVKIFGFRFGVTPEGRKYWSFGIPGTGIYFKKHIK